MLKPLESTKKLRVVVDMNDSKSWAQVSRCYEQLKVVNDMKYSRSWAQRTRFYE